MQYKFFTNSANAWGAMWSAVENARESVYLEMYIFQDDMEKFNFSELLERKAQAGVRVRIVLDSFGSSELSSGGIQRMQDSGVEVLFLSSFWHRVHKKILIVDEEVAFIGGVNLHKSAELWQDLMVRIKGVLVKRIIRVFAKDYKNAGGKDVHLILQNKKVFFHKTRTWLVEHLPIKRKFRMKKVYQMHIGGAKKSITLVTPYFMPKRWFVALLHQAVLRGVEVNVLVPREVEKSFYNVMNKANYFYILRASKLGVNFYLEPFMNHAKVLVIDGGEALVGSQNLDFLSFELNSEIGVFFKDEYVAEKLLSIIEGWKSKSTSFKAEDYKLSYIDTALSHILNLFVRIL